MKRIAAVAIAVLCVAGVILFATGVNKLEVQYEFNTTWGIVEELDPLITPLRSDIILFISLRQEA